MNLIRKLLALVDARGAAAAEFALTIPALCALLFGSIGLSTMMSVTSALHFAVEKAARCASINAALTGVTTCSGSTNVQTYATSQYKGPALTGLAFTLTAATTANCGNRVVGSGTYVLRTGLATVSVPVTAAACYPTG
jgi:Flp pilus assembly protein TadG